MAPSAVKYDLTRRNKHPFEQGATFQLQFTYWEDLRKRVGIDEKDLTSYTARMHVRDHHDSPDPPTLEVNTEGPVTKKITLGGTSGTILVDVDSATTKALQAPFNGVYDLELINAAGHVERFVEGEAEVTPEVTRES